MELTRQKSTKDLAQEMGEVLLAKVEDLSNAGLPGCFQISLDSQNTALQIEEILRDSKVARFQVSETDNHIPQDELVVMEAEDAALQDSPQRLPKSAH